VKTRMIDIPRIWPLAVVAAALLCGCAGKLPYRPPGPVPDDRRHIEKPRSRDVNILGELAENQVLRQMEQMFDVARISRRVTGHPKEARNVDAFDEVPNSSWFTNRNHRVRMSIEEFRRGPNTVDGPDMTGTCEIVRAKTQGVTPGFTIVDGRGDPELITGAEAAATLLFYAAGYHTPENHVVYFDPTILRLAEGVKLTGEDGKRRDMTQGDLDEILSRVTIGADGRVRAVASKYIDGVPVGPFKYEGTRDDDPNDIIPHQHRRELRGLRLIAAWLSHYDTKSGNTLDSYVTVDGRSYVRHYLIDFGSTLGCGPRGPEPRFRGHENDFDPHAIAFNIATLGLYVHPYERLEYPKSPALGLYESELFEPQEYKVQSPNPAFENLTHRDGYWAAKIVMSFTDEQLRAAVEAAEYSDPSVEDYLTRVLIERRDKVGRYYFSRVNPLDHFELVGGTLSYTDLAVESGLEDAGATRYRYTLCRDGETVVKDVLIGNAAAVQLGEHVAGDGQLECSIVTSRAGGKWSQPVRVYIEAGAAPKLVGLRREG
jgi:hypothetical protein